MMSIGSLSLSRQTTRASGKRVRAPFAVGGIVASANGTTTLADNSALERKPAMVRPPKETTDFELLERFQKGDEEGYVELYLRRQAEVYTFCLRLAGGDSDFASDLFQETFIKVYRKAHTFHEGTNVLGWLYTIVRTTFLNHKRRRTLVPLDDTHDMLRSTDRSLEPDFNEEQSTIKSRVERAISNLPVEIREPFILREFDGFSYQEIADQLSLTLGGVRQRIYRAKLAMREELWDLVHDDPMDTTAFNFDLGEHHGNL